MHACNEPHAALCLAICDVLIIYVKLFLLFCVSVLDTESDRARCTAGAECIAWCYATALLGSGLVTAALS